MQKENQKGTAGLLQSTGVSPGEQITDRLLPERKAADKPAHDSILSLRLPAEKYSVEIAAKLHINLEFDNWAQDLCKILLNQGLEDKLNEPIWTEDTEPWEVLAWMFKLYDSLLPDGVEWHLFDEPRRIVNRYVYPVDSLTIYAMPLCFLPELKKVRPDLYKLILDTVSAVVDLCDLRLWDEETDMFLEWYCEMYADSEDPAEKESLRTTLDVYCKGGIAQEYWKKIHKNKITDIELRATVDAFDPKGSLEEKIKAWAELACGLIHSNFKLYDFIDHDEDEMETQGIEDYEFDTESPCRIIRFFWSVDDHMYGEVENAISESSGNYGFRPLRTYSVIQPDKTEPLVNDFEILSGPQVVLKFFTDGIGWAEEIKKEVFLWKASRSLTTATI